MTKYEPPVYTRGAQLTIKHILTECHNQLPERSSVNLCFTHLYEILSPDPIIAMYNPFIKKKKMKSV